MEPNSFFTATILEWFASYPWFGFLLGMMLVDYISGVTAAIYEGKLNSKIGYRGAMKKSAVLLVVAVGFLIERGIISTLPAAMQPTWNYPVAKLVAAFFLFNEALSVLENAKRCGVPLPKFLTKGLSDAMSKVNTYGEPDAPTAKETKVTVEMKETTPHSTNQTAIPPVVTVETKTTSSAEMKKVE